MFRFTSCLAMVVALCCAGQARADFVLSGNEHLEVNSVHDRGDLSDSSTVDLLLGAYIKEVHVMDEALLRFLGGDVRQLHVHGSVEVFAGPTGWGLTSYVYSGGVIDIFSGVFGRLTSVQGPAGVVNIHGGTFPGSSTPDCFFAHESIRVNVFGGVFERGVSVSDASEVVISGGTFAHRLSASGTSGLDISGGTFLSDLVVMEGSTLSVSGGDFPVLIVGDTSSVSFQGYEFGASDGLHLDGDRVLGSGTLTGKWEDGTSWAVSIPYIGSSATIRIITEPFSTSTWDNGSGDSNWANAANWNPDQLPDAAVPTTIASGDTVLVNSPGQAAKAVSVESNSTLHVTTGGQLAVAGGMAIKSSSKLKIDVSGSVCSRPDVTGLLELEPTASLALDWIPAGPSSKFGGDYVVVTYGTRTGEFDTVGGGSGILSIGEAYVAGIDYETGDQITVSLHPLLDGDADLDGKVWLSDWAALRANFGNTGAGKTWADGNFDPWTDGKVWLSDWAALRANFSNAGYTASGAAAVPEPGTLVMLLGVLAGLGVCAWRRRRR